MKAERDEDTAEEKFKASRLWFMRFKEGIHCYGIDVQREAANAGVEAAASFPETSVISFMKATILATLQVFSVEETVLYWKKLPSRTFIARERKVNA